MRTSLKWAAVLFAGVVFFGCAPQAQFFNVDVRSNAKTDLPLSNKTLAVFSISSQNNADSMRLSNVAVGLAEKLEEDRSLDKGNVAVYSIPKIEFRGFPSAVNENVQAVDTAYLTGLMLNSGADILFFVDNLRFRPYTAQKSAVDTDRGYNGVSLIIPYSVEMNVFDVMTDELLYKREVLDSIYLQVLSSHAPDANFSGVIAEHLPEIARKIGVKLASYVSTQWSTQERMLITYEGELKWEKPYLLAMDFKWEEAIAQWMKLVETENPKKAAFAAYNIAIGCEMLEQFALAQKWVQYSLQQFQFREAEELRIHLAQIKRPVVVK